MPDQFLRRVLAPSECSADELAAFCTLVNLGNPAASLSPGWVADHAFKLCFVSLGDALVAVGGLKNPQRAYHRRCFREAGRPTEWTAYPVELGWIYCRDDFRGGMAARIIDPLLMEDEGKSAMYAVVRADNHRMSSPLRKRDFRAIGGLYRSLEHPDAQVELLVREGL